MYNTYFDIFDDFSLGLRPFLPVLNGTISEGYSPRYNIERKNKDTYQIHLAVPGYNDSDLEITQEGSKLIISGHPTIANEDVTVLERGISERSFSKSFRLGEHVLISGAELSKGILTVNLSVEIPEELRPRNIPIGSSNQIENKKTAA